MCLDTRPIALGPCLAGQLTESLSALPLDFLHAHMFQRTRNLAVTRGVLNAVNSNACAKFIGSRVPDVFIRLAHVPPQIRALEEIGAALEQRVKPEGPYRQSM